MCSLLSPHVTQAGNWHSRQTLYQRRLASRLNAAGGNFLPHGPWHRGISAHTLHVYKSFFTFGFGVHISVLCFLQVEHNGYWHLRQRSYQFQLSFLSNSDGAVSLHVVQCNFCVAASWHSPQTHSFNRCILYFSGVFLLCHTRYILASDMSGTSRNHQWCSKSVMVQQILVFARTLRISGTDN